MITGRTETAHRSVKTWIESIKILGIKLILNRSERFAETLEMHNLTSAKETDRICYVRFLHEPEDVIIGAPGFLLCRQIFMKIRDWISL